MQNNVRELLPIGTVVLLKGATKKAMIYGVKQIDQASNTEYDYLGVVYPEGNLGEGTQFFFNHENVQEVFYRGYEDEERKGFIERLALYYDQKQDE